MITQKTIKIWYWIVTMIFVAFMLFSGISELMGTKQGNDLLIHLRYPLYINVILGIAKILGAIALTIPGFKTLKEWAYAGFTFDILGASASYALNGDSFGDAFMPLIFLLVMFISYALWKKASD